MYGEYRYFKLRGEVNGTIGVTHSRQQRNVPVEDADDDMDADIQMAIEVTMYERIACEQGDGEHPIMLLLHTPTRTRAENADSAEERRAQLKHILASMEAKHARQTAFIRENTLEYVMST